MNLFPALLARDVDWGNAIVFVLVVVVPLLLRLFKWLFVRLGLLREGEAEVDPDAQRERLRRLREERRRAETEGEDLWRKLARGEIGEPLAPAPAPERLPAPVPASLSLESEEEPEPLSVLGESGEPSEAPEESLEREEEPVPLATLAEPVALAPARLEEAPEAPGASRFRLVRGDLRRAIVLSEILGAPVSERSLRA